MQQNIKHLLYVPFTGLGNFGGHRGSRWLKNRIKIFKQFVIPSLLNQTNKNFILWISWRYEDKDDKIINEFEEWLKTTGLHFFFTYTGVCFWDDKHPDHIARERLLTAIHGAMGEILNNIGECDEVLMTIQPSDDLYYNGMVNEVQRFFQENKNTHVFGYAKGYVIDYLNRRVAEWNPKTTPPFYTIRFPRETFMDPLKHTEYTGPYKSHEFVKDYLPAKYIDHRGFLVGTHGINISTVFDHPYTGHEFLGSNIDNILLDFGIKDVPKLKISRSPQSILFNKLPYKIKRKLRYWSEKNKIVSLMYNFLRS